MAYATQQDIIDRGLTERELGELADDDNVGKLDDAAVQAKILGALNEASATVDAYCRQRYTIPLQASDKVKAIAVTIAMHALFSGDVACRRT
jgi:phage gp36-like protein